MTTTANTSLPTPKHLGHGLTTWAMKTSSHSSPIPPEVFLLQGRQFRRITPLPLQTTCRWTTGDATSTSTRRNVWSPTWKPCKTALDSYECRHGMSYTRITGAKDGIEASLLFFVPLKTWGRGAEADLAEYFCQSEKTQTVLFCRMVLVECRYGHGELPA